jgi:hypothetical protein
VDSKTPSAVQLEQWMNTMEEAILMLHHETGVKQLTDPIIFEFQPYPTKYGIKICTIGNKKSRRQPAYLLISCL